MRRLVMVVMMMVVIVMLVVAVAHARAPCGSGRHRAWRHRCQSPITRELIEG
jgi:Tfp pilus assembly protein PilX